MLPATAGSRSSARCSLAGGTVVGLASPAAAEYIRELDVAVTVNADTSIRIVETITYDFESEYRHGIFRDIPVYDETLTGQRRQYGVAGGRRHHGRRVRCRGSRPRAAPSST